MSEGVSKRPLPPSTAESSPAGSDCLDVGFEPVSPFPRTVTAAGVIWIIVGGLPLLSVVALLLLAILIGLQRNWGPFLEVFNVGFFVVVFAASVLYIGIQCLRGADRDILIAAVVSIALGLVLLAVGVMWLAPTQPNYTQGPSWAYNGLHFLTGFLLFVAGVLALVGRSQYKLWRQVQMYRREREIVQKADDGRFHK